MEMEMEMEIEKEKQSNELRLFLKQLTDLSEKNEKETIFFHGMTINMIMLFYITIMKKYNNSCFLHLPIPKKMYHSHTYYSFFEKNTNLKMLASQIITCINNGTNIIIIPYKLSNYDESAHANMFIYKVIGNIHQIDHFEPHGEKVLDDRLHRLYLREFDHQITTLQSLIKKYYQQKKINIEQIYNEPANICPVSLGPQIKHNEWLNTSSTSGLFKTHKNSGLCSYWSYLIAEIVLKFPHLETSFIVNELLYYSKEDNPNLNDVIRGYIFYNENDLLKTYNKFSSVNKEGQEDYNKLHNKLHNYIYKKYLKNSLFGFIPKIVSGARKNKKSTLKKTLKKRKKKNISVNNQK